MKALIFFFFVMISMIEIKAQTSAQLDINNINARVNTIYKPLFNGLPGFEVSPGLRTIYATNFWIGAKDLNDSLHIGIGTYSQSRDFIPGPIMDSLHYGSQIPQWNRVWKITKSDIDYHILNYAQSGYVIPQVFLDWPANGDTSLGQAESIAPFFDVNGNGIYDPNSGDYPKVPGDECIFYIFNDDTIHTASGGKKMKIEIHAFVYAFNCQSDTSLMNSIFVKFKIINRSEKTYYNTILGSWTDLDIGGSINDFIGCNLQNGSYYGYNGTNNDDLAFEDYLPAQSVTILAGPFEDADNLDNPITSQIQNAIDSSGIPYEGLGMNYNNEIVDDERIGMSGFLSYNIGGGPQGDPAIKNEFYNYLTGFWKDDTHILYGGTGYYNSPNAIANGLIETKYMYPSDSDPLLWGTQGVPIVTPNWSEVTSGNGVGDRRGVGYSGPFTFESGSIEELDLAYVYARDYINMNDNISPIAIMNNRIASVRNYFISNQTPCGTGFQNPLSLNKIEPDQIYFSIYPNPSSSYFTLNFEGEIKNLNYSIHDILGKEILSGRINSAQTKIDCENWSSGVYLIKVGDENGYSVKKMVVEK